MDSFFLVNAIIDMNFISFEITNEEPILDKFHLINKK